MVMRKNTLERLLILITSLIIAIMLFTGFQVLSPFSLSAIPRELREVSGVEETEVQVVEFVVRIVYRWGNLTLPVQGMVVRVNERVGVTGSEGVARFMLVPASYSVSVTSPEGLLPSWFGEVRVSGIRTVLNLGYLELRANPSSVKTEIDYRNASTRVEVSSSLPSYEAENPAAVMVYVGSPSIYYLDQAFKPLLFVDGRVYDGELGLGFFYRRSYTPIPPVSLNSSYVYEENIPGVVRLVFAEETYIPVVVVEPTLVEMS